MIGEMQGMEKIVDVLGTTESMAVVPHLLSAVDHLLYSAENKAKFCEKSGVAVLVRLLAQNEPQMNTRIMWILRNLSSDRMYSLFFISFCIS